MADADAHHIAWAKKLLSNDDERHELCDKEFVEADADGTGDLSVDEVVKLVNKICRSMNLILPKKEKVAGLVEACDKSKDGDLQLNEFRTCFKTLLKACLQEAEKETVEEYQARLKAQQEEEAAEKAAAEAAEKEAAEKAAAEKSAAEAAEKEAAEKAAAEKAAAEKAAAEKAAAEADEKEAAEKASAEKATAEKAAAEAAEKESAEKAAAEKATAEKAAAEAAEKEAAERAAAEKAAAQKAAAEKAVAEKASAAQVSAVPSPVQSKAWTPKQQKAYDDSTQLFDDTLKIAEKALKFLKGTDNMKSIKAKANRTELFGALPKLAQAIDTLNRGNHGDHEGLSVAFGPSSDRLPRLKALLTSDVELREEPSEMCVRYLAANDEEVAGNSMHQKSVQHIISSYECVVSVVKEYEGHTRRKSSFEGLGGGGYVSK